MTSTSALVVCGLEQRRNLPVDLRLCACINRALIFDSYTTISRINDVVPLQLLSVVGIQIVVKTVFYVVAVDIRELPVKKGDFINIVRRVDTNWYEATKDGRVGIVPVTYIQVCRRAAHMPM